jgi:hypothetical protein
VLPSEADRISNRRWIEFRAAVGAFLLCAGLTILPALVALDAVVWVGCRHLDRAACVALVVSAVTTAEMAQGGLLD